MKMPRDCHPDLELLKSEFTTFRTQCRPNTRIPKHFRKGVLAALSSGLSRTLVLRTLGLHSGQVAIWEHRNRKAAAVPKNSPRVLKVVPVPPAPELPAGLRISYEGGRLLLELSL